MRVNGQDFYTHVLSVHQIRLFFASGTASRHYFKFTGLCVVPSLSLPASQCCVPCSTGAKAKLPGAICSFWPFSECVIDTQWRSKNGMIERLRFQADWVRGHLRVLRRWQDLFTRQSLVLAAPPLPTVSAHPACLTAQTRYEIGRAHV